MCVGEIGDGAETSDRVLDILGALVRLRNPSYAVEVGTYRGKSARVIAANLKGGRLHTIDPCRDCWENARHFTDLPITACYMRADQFIPAEPIDFLFIDGDPHERASDFEHFRPYLHPDAIVAIDDPDRVSIPGSVVLAKALIVV